MKVILKQTLPKVGKEGQVVDVAAGFARNYLFPRRLADLADKAGLARLERVSAKLASDAEKTKATTIEATGQLSGATIRIVRPTAKGSTKLFGAVTSAHIADAIKENLGVEIEKRSVAIMHPLKRLGVYDILIAPHRDVEATIRLEIADEEGNLGIELPQAEMTEEYKQEMEEVEPETAKAEEKTQPSEETEEKSEEIEKPDKKEKGNRSADAE